MKYCMIVGAALLLAGSSAGASRAQGDDQSQPQRPQHGQMLAACKADIDKLCPGLEPGRPTFQCVREHQDDLSDGCKTALASARSHGGWRHRQDEGRPEPGGAAPMSGDAPAPPAEPAPPPTPPQ